MSTRQVRVRSTRTRIRLTSEAGKLPVSVPRSVGTTPVFYNYLKGSRPLDAGQVLDNGVLKFGHQYVLDSPVPLWSFGQVGTRIVT